MSRSVAVLYCRTSTWGQALKSSLWRQQSQGAAFAQQNNIHLHAVFSEIGSRTDDLPIRKQVVKLVQKLGCRLLVEHLDRIVCSSETALYYDLEDLLSVGRLIAVRGGDLSSLYDFSEEVEV